MTSPTLESPVTEADAHRFDALADRGGDAIDGVETMFRRVYAGKPPDEVKEPIMEVLRAMSGLMKGYRGLLDRGMGAAVGEERLAEIMKQVDEERKTNDN